MANNEFDIFNVGVDDLDTGSDASSSKSDLYAPKPEQGTGGTYSSLIRFLPNLKNPRKPFIRKFIHWLEDSSGNNGFYVDSPTTVGEKCPIQDMFFKLRNSESAVEQKMSETLKRKEVYYALIQVIKDSHNPDLEGQIKIFKYGWKIKTKIDEELNPKFDEPTQIFDPFEGKNFELTITKKGGYPNYDSCKFQGSRSPMQINGKAVSDSDEGRKQIIEYLSNSPDLSSFDYKPWSDDDRNRVMNFLSEFKSPGTSISNISRGNSTEESYTPPRNKQNESSSETADVVSDTVSSDSDDLNDFLNGLDI